MPFGDVGCYLRHRRRGPCRERSDLKPYHAERHRGGEHLWVCEEHRLLLVCRADVGVDAELLGDGRPERWRERFGEVAVRAFDGVELELVLLGVAALLPGLVDAVVYELPVEYEVDVLGEPLDAVVCLWQARPALEHEGVLELAAVGQVVECVANPQVLLHDPGPEADLHRHGLDQDGAFLGGQLDDAQHPLISFILFANSKTHDVEFFVSR